MTTTEVHPLTDKIEHALDTIRPYLLADGGNVKLLEITEGLTARVEFIGSCGSCKMSTMTFKAGVEEAIKREVPEILLVEAVNLTVA
ncbi:MAG: NifU family protein [Cytophagales bacterium]|nr:NifU family protein [Cytophagales bacterium]